MDFLTNPFTTALLFLYQLLNGNIFLTIVAFTIVIRLLLLPLTAQQLKSTKATQALQPKLKELQELYKGDREKLAKAQMELYQKNGVNPVAGCLPLVIQMPILLGLYGAISRALSATPLQVLDLSHRILIPGLSTNVPMQNHFLIWNLATPDTTFILPILVVGSTWLSQKLLTPAPAAGGSNDPTAAMSRNMLIMMPLMMGFFSINVASGLAMYWIIGGIAVILQYIALGRVQLQDILPGFLRRNQPVPATALTVSAPVSEKPVTTASMKSTSKAAKRSNTDSPQPIKRSTAKATEPGDPVPIAAVPLRKPKSKK